jgi:hypothetical protein
MTATSLSHTFEDEKDLRRLSWCWAKAYDAKVPKDNPTRAARSLSLNLNRTGSCCDQSARQLSSGFTAVSMLHLSTNR